MQKISNKVNIICCNEQVTVIKLQLFLYYKNNEEFHLIKTNIYIYFFKC